MFPLQRFKEYINQNSLVKNGEKALLAVSGGRDSVLLVHLFHESGLAFGIAHCNFHLRNEESDRDEAFVKELAVKFGVPFHCTHFDTIGAASRNGISIQMAARRLRYDWFEEIRREEQYAAVAVAHHLSDAVETLLMNLCRGTGIAGLHGIASRRDSIIRPLLFLTRSEIDEIVAEEGLAYVEDSSNASDKYARNKIRLQVMPQLKAINPNVEHTFEQNIARFRQTEQVLQQYVGQLRKEILLESGSLIKISLSSIRRLEPAELLLSSLLTPYHFEEPVVKEILVAVNRNPQSGLQFFSGTHQALINRTDLLITPLSGRHEEMVTIDRDATRVVFNEHTLDIYYVATGKPVFQPNLAYVDQAALVYPLILRYRQEGDRFMPLGMRSFKKLSDFLIDEKVSLIQKDRIPILENGNGEIIWVAGMRVDNRYKLTVATKKVAIFELKFNESTFH